jgi:hypothetical protein
MRAKKDHELYHLLQFKDVFDNFPGGEIIRSESPDFIVNNGDKKIGIEVTKIFKSTRSGEPPLQAIEATCRKIASSASKICAERKIPPLTVSLHFIRKQEILHVRRGQLSRQIADFVCNNIPLPEAYQSFHPEHGDSTLPNHVHAITIGRFSVLTKHDFNVPSADWAQKDFSAEIQQAINSKNPKLIHYNDSCAEHWLLIVSEGSGPSSFFDLSGGTRDVVFESRFDRNFFMEAFFRVYWELRSKAYDN